MIELGHTAVHRLVREQVVPAPLDRIFGFFESPYNLALITPPSLCLRVITPPPISMRAGLKIDYSLRLGGFKLHWRSLISAYEPPYRFVDEQLIGPYASWRHTHTFERCERGTLLRDEVAYALPEILPPPIEKLAHRHYVATYLRNIFDYRARFYQSFFDAGSSQSEARSLQPDNEGTS